LFWSYAPDQKLLKSSQAVELIESNLFAGRIQGVGIMLRSSRPTQRPNNVLTWPRAGFTLVELLVVIAIIGVLVALLLPAIQAAREAARRSQCLNNIKQISLAMLNYESAKGGLPPMAMNWTGADMTKRYGANSYGGWYDDHGWYIPVMPFLEQGQLASLVDPKYAFSHVRNRPGRNAFVPMFACPSDIGLQRNEWPRADWSRVRTNYAVNAGNTTYGQNTLEGPCPGFTAPPNYCTFKGAPFIPRDPGKLAAISDGTSNTLMVSEGFVLPETEEWGGPYSDSQTALGGGTFTGWNVPNTPINLDCHARFNDWQGLPGVQPAYVAMSGLWPLPAAAGTVSCGPRVLPLTTPGSVASTPEGADGDVHRAGRFSARSRHVGGVNASRCDGSVGYFNDSVDRAVWQALSSAAGDETVSAP
jgi:prepilin-type N-terminal cleavage/methylation domain-containing protein